MKPIASLPISITITFSSHSVPSVSWQSVIFSLVQISRSEALESSLVLSLFLFLLGIYVKDDEVIHFTRCGQVGTRTLLDLLVCSGPARSHLCSPCVPPEDGHGVVSVSELLPCRWHSIPL